MLRLRHLLLPLGIALLTACGSDASPVIAANGGASGSQGGQTGAPDNTAGAPDDDSAAGAPDNDGAAGAADDGDDDDDDANAGCMPDDQDGVVGGNNTVKLYITDTSFNVGTKDSGQPNIAVQNSANVTLTITNVGTTPHGFQVGCRPTELPAPCAQTSCFPAAANVPAIGPGASVTVKFQTPIVEGEYRFTSDEPGDDALVGEFVLM